MATRVLHKLFVGNLPWTIGHRELRSYFSEFGSVSSAIVIFDKNSGFSRGYGFVQFADKSGFDNVTNKQSHMLEGSRLVVKSAN